MICGADMTTKLATTAVVAESTIMGLARLADDPFCEFAIGARPAFQCVRRRGRASNDP